MPANSDVQLEVVVVTGTNDLNRRYVTPQSLIDQLVDHTAVLKEFCNVKNIFVCKITPRCDQHVINSKVSEYNELLDEHFSNQDSLTVLPSIPLGASLLYKDNLHLSAKGLRQVSGIILSNLYHIKSLLQTLTNLGLGVNLNQDEMPRAVTKLKIVNIGTTQSPALHST